MQIMPYGENALLLNFDQQMSPEVNQQVQSWETRIRTAQLPGLSHFIPAYASLTVVFEQALRNPEATIEYIRKLADQSVEQDQKNHRKLKIPVCYDTDFALDQTPVMELLGLEWGEVIRLHTQTIFTVYMLGFSPGFAFMGRLSEALNISRKKNPRLKVPPRSVGLAGAQTGIYPDEIPGGWQLIGRTPIPPFRPLAKDVFLFQPGDQIQFYPIEKDEYQAIRAQIEAQNFDWASLQAKP